MICKPCTKQELFLNAKINNKTRTVKPIIKLVHATRQHQNIQRRLRYQIKHGKNEGIASGVGTLPASCLAWWRGV